MKTVLFVPGWRENFNSRDYQSVLSVIEANGYKTRFITIDWNRTNISDWVNELGIIYDQYDPRQTILAGFSYGAMATFVAATRRRPSELWLFSLSPYFSDDIPKLNDGDKKIVGKKRIEEFSHLSFAELARKLTNVKTKIWVGSEERPLTIKQAEIAHALIENSALVIVNGAKHDVSDKRYVDAIKNNL